MVPFVRPGELRAGKTTRPNHFPPFPLLHLRVCDANVLNNFCSVRSANRPLLRVRTIRKDEAEFSQFG